MDMAQSQECPATFQRAMDVIIAYIHWKCSLVYLDGIGFFTKSSVVHIGRVWRVLRLLHEAGMALELKKWKFFTKKIDYVGHVIPSGRLELAQHTTDALERL